MTLETQPGADGTADQAPIETFTVDTDQKSISPSEAGRLLSAARVAKRAKEQEQAPAESAPEATPDESAQADAAPPEEATSETQDTDPAVEELSPIERPRSWSKEKDAAWAKLDRETQEFLVEHDREVSKGVRNAQNEAAEKLKGLTAKEQQVEQARQQYESAFPILMQNLQSAMAGEFSDINTMADVQRMANEDFPRYVRWDAQQKQLAAVQQEITSAQQRQTTERQQKLEEFRTSESLRLLDALPDLADQKKLASAQTAAVAVLKDVGFKDDELGASFRGEKDISIHDHRFQRILHEAAQWRDAKSKEKAIVAKPLPPVQRPGVAKPKGADADAQIQALRTQLTRTNGSIQGARIGAQLLRAQRLAAR